MDDRKQLSREELILKTIAATGLVAVAIIAPNVVGAILKLTGKRRYPSYVYSVLSRMEQKGLIAFEYKNKQKYARLTEKGKVELDALTWKEKQQRRKRWDGNWRIVIFDIREYKRGKRNQIRAELNNVGFVQLQESVWVYPFECREIEALLKAKYKLGNEVQYIVARSIENDHNLKKHFKIK